MALGLPAILIMPVAAQRLGVGWTWQNPLPQGNPLYAVHFAADKATGYAVGSNNTILRTTDGGFSWTEQTARTDVAFSGVFVRDKDNAFLVGSRGTVLTTTNAGKVWKPVRKATQAA